MILIPVEGNVVNGHFKLQW